MRGYGANASLGENFSPLAFPERPRQWAYPGSRPIGWDAIPGLSTYRARPGKQQLKRPRDPPPHSRHPGGGRDLRQRATRWLFRRKTKAAISAYHHEHRPRRCLSWVPTTVYPGRRSGAGMTARGMGDRLSSTKKNHHHSPRLQHLLPQSYPHSSNWAHTHPRPMRMRGRLPVATVGGVWVGRSEGQTRVRSRCRYFFRARRPAPRKGSRRAQTREARRSGAVEPGVWNVIHRVLRVGQKSCREVARCCFSTLARMNGRNELYQHSLMR
jgi:hypothetical protein